MPIPLIQIDNHDWLDEFPEEKQLIAAGHRHAGANRRPGIVLTAPPEVVAPPPRVNAALESLAGRWHKQGSPS